MRWEVLHQGRGGPVARSAHCIVACGQVAYLFAGEQQPRHPIDGVVHAFDLKTRQWSELQVRRRRGAAAAGPPAPASPSGAHGRTPPPHTQASGPAPSPRIAPAAAAVGTTIYVFGGRTGVEMGEGALGDTWALDVAAPAWRRVECVGASPPPRSFHAAAALGGKFYVFGGCGAEGRLGDLWEFDPATSAWLELPSSPAIKGRGGAGMVALPATGQLVVVGGFCGHELADVHCYDVAAARWEEVAAGGDAFPARSVFAAAATGDEAVVVFGGEVDPSDAGHEGAGQFTAALHRLDMCARAWERVDAAGEPPCPRGWMAAAACGEGVLVSAGLNDANERLGDLHLLRLQA